MASKIIDDTVIIYETRSKDPFISSTTSNRRFLYTAVCIANTVAFAIGIPLAWTSPVIPKLTNPNNLADNPLGRVISKEEETWIGSLMAVGGILGPFAAGYASDKIGRKKALIIFGGFAILLSNVLLAIGRHIVLYYIGRFLAGFANGSVYTILPNFNSEIAETCNRGALSSSINIFVILGPLFAYVLGPYLSVMWFGIACAVVPAVFIVLFSIFVPESPYYLVAKNDIAAAVTSLQKFRSCKEHNKILKEIEILKLTIEESVNNKPSFKDLLKSKCFLKALCISLTLVGVQQFSGISIVLFYTQSIFDAAGDMIPSKVAPIIVGSVQVIAGFVTPLIVDKAGRKILFLISAIGMLISEISLGTFFYFKDAGSSVDPIYWLPIASLVLYIISFHLGFGPLPWTVMAEIFPPSSKAIASTATASFAWFSGFVVSKYFYSVAEIIGMGGSFWIFSGICALAAIFVSTILFETKGKSLKDIQEILAK